MIENPLRLTKLALALLAVAVASSTTRAAAQQAPRNPGSYLVTEVGHQLRMLPYFTVFDDLSYKIDGYNVTLMGEVTNPVLKSDAGNVVKHIEGVQNVINNIKVLPVSDMDWQIRRAEFRAIYSEPQLTKYGFQAFPSIHILVDNGHVTLTGIVDNQADKNVVGIRANGVPGVFSVTNDLRVEKQK